MRHFPIAFALILFATGAFADANWFAFRDPDGVFTVDVPSTPAVSRSSVTADNGQSVPMLQYAIDRGADGMFVIVSDLSAFPLGDSGTVIDNAVNGIKRLGVSVPSDTGVTLDGQAGREVQVVDKDGNRIEDRIFYVGRKLYQVMHVLGPTAAAASEADARRFDDSFHFIGR
jgi:hypothetical protein